MNKKKEQFNTSKVLTASEIGAYHYCPNAWYLKRCGFQPHSPALQEGVEHHQNVGKSIQKLPRQQHATHILQKLALLSLLLSVVLFILGGIGL